jgi:multisubunit Na+/H+ antiporter MnhB subunit
MRSGVSIRDQRLGLRTLFAAAAMVICYGVGLIIAGSSEAGVGVLQGSLTAALLFAVAFFLTYSQRLTPWQLIVALILFEIFLVCAVAFFGGFSVPMLIREPSLREHFLYWIVSVQRVYVIVPWIGAVAFGSILRMRRGG